MAVVPFVYSAICEPLSEWRWRLCQRANDAPINFKAYMNSDDSGKLFLRVTLGCLMLFHGIAKLVGGVDAIGRMLAAQGLPTSLSYLVLIGEVVAPLLLLVGITTRLAAVAIAINMVVAVSLAHSTQLLTIGKTGGWTLELQGFYFLVAVAIAILGPGRYRVVRTEASLWQ